MVKLKIKLNRPKRKNKLSNHRKYREIRNRITKKLKNPIKIMNKSNMMISKLNKESKLDLKQVVIQGEGKFKT